MENMKVISGGGSFMSDKHRQTAESVCRDVDAENESWRVGGLPAFLCRSITE